MNNLLEINEPKRMSPEDAFEAKLDLFMEHHIVPFSKAEDIHWWISVSGGKDSYAMAHGIRNWYEKKRIEFKGTVFLINQWNGPSAKFIKNKFKGFDVEVLDAHIKSTEIISYLFGQQAPCRDCSDIRRSVTDDFIKTQKNKSKVNIVCRGLHLSDMAVSLLWRFIIKSDQEYKPASINKGLPLVHLWDNVYLAKPLAYVREYEAQQYSKLFDHEPLCCGCPACLFPSRRDIVEESILQFNRNPLWEFLVPGVSDFITDKLQIDSKVLKEISAPGLETKSPHLPKDFGEFAVEFFTKKTKMLPINFYVNNFDEDKNLDDIGRLRIEQFQSRVEIEIPPLPAILRSDAIISNKDAMMIGTLGPFWGAIGLSPEKSSQVFTLQKQYFGFDIDEKWNHVTHLLKEYHGGENGELAKQKKRSVHHNDLFSNCLCRH